MKYLLATVAVLLISKTAISQVYRNFNFYNYDPKLINPGYAGLLTSQDYQLQIARNDGGAPSKDFSMLTAFSGKINSANSGYGGIVSYYHSDFYYEYNGSLQYNYQLKLGNDRTLSAGTQWRVSSFHTTFDSYAINPGDPIFASQNETINRVYGDFGMVYRARKFNVGVATTDLIRTKTSESSQLISYKLFSMYNFKVASWLEITPSILISSTLKDKPNIEFNNIVKLANLVLLGTTWEDFFNHYYLKYSAGVEIRNRLQFVTILYAGYNHAGYTSSYGAPQGSYIHNLNLETMLRWRIESPVHNPN